jgi:hypothetical protein
MSKKNTPITNRSAKIAIDSEYYRICPYCGEEFIASHLLRVFCPKKYGKKDFCKSHFKAMLADANLIQRSALNIVESTDSFTRKETIPSTLVENNAVSVNQSTSISLPPPNPIARMRALEIIEQMLQGCDVKEFDLKEIDISGLDISVFDHQFPLPKCNLFGTELGNYSLFWTHKNKLLITKSSETLWISQQ